MADDQDRKQDAGPGSGPEKRAQGFWARLFRRKDRSKGEPKTASEDAAPAAQNPEATEQTRTEQAETPAEVAPASDRERRALKYHCERREVREAKIAYLFDESVGTDQIRRFFELLEQDENVHDTEYTVTFRTDDGVRTQAFRRVSDIDEHYWTDGKTNGFSVNVTSHNSRPSILIYSFLKNFLVVEAMLAPRIIEVVDACMERPLGS